MIELSVSETTTYRWSFDQDALAYSEAGIPAMGVWREKLGDFGVLKAAELLTDQNVKASHLFWAGGFTGSDGRRFSESLQDAKEAIQEAADIDCRCLAICTGSEGGHTRNHARRLVAEAIRELVPFADVHGVTLALEPMHPGCAENWTFLTSLDDTVRFIDDFADPRVKVVLDTYHLGNDPAVLERVESIVPYLALVQLGDFRIPPNGEQNRCRLGDGVIPLREIVAALIDAGYQGYFDVELMGEELEACDYRLLLEHAKEAFDRLLPASTT